MPHGKGKSLSALLYVEHGENMFCTKIVLNVRNNFCTKHVLPMFSPCSAKRRASDKDLPVQIKILELIANVNWVEL